MKLIKVYLNAGIDKEFREIIKSNGIDEYMKIPKAMGKIAGLDPMEDNHVWPGYFVVYEIPVDGKRAKTLLKGIKEYAERYKNEGVCVLVQDVECIKGR